MSKGIAKWWAKLRYIWQEQVKAETLLINARASERTAEKVKAFIQQLHAKAEAADGQASTLEQGIKDVDEKMAKGFWQCENGHESPKCDLDLCNEHEAMACAGCKAEAAGEAPCDVCGKRELFNLRRAAATGSQTVIVVEGYFDCRALL
jgi:hypothetical protein